MVHSWIEGPEQDGEMEQCMNIMKLNKGKCQPYPQEEINQAPV